jgi:hypothetical protein
VRPEDFAVSGALHERRQHVAKGKVIAGMTMSLDGFVADADGNVDASTQTWPTCRERRT